MAIPTIGEQRFQAQLLHAIDEVADSIRENNRALRELAAAIRERRPAPPPGEPGH